MFVKTKLNDLLSEDIIQENARLKIKISKCKPHPTLLTCMIKT